MSLALDAVSWRHRELAASLRLKIAEVRSTVAPCSRADTVLAEVDAHLTKQQASTYAPLSAAQAERDVNRVLGPRA